MTVEVTAIGQITVWIGRCQCTGCKNGSNDDNIVGGLWDTEQEIIIYRSHGYSLTEVFTDAIDRAVERAIDERVGGRLWQ